MEIGDNYFNLAVYSDDTVYFDLYHINTIGSYTFTYDRYMLNSIVPKAKLIANDWHYLDCKSLFNTKFFITENSIAKVYYDKIIEMYEF